MADKDSMKPHTHDHVHPVGVIKLLSQLFHLDGHQHTPLVGDNSFTATQEGIRTVWLALAALGITSVLQIAIVVLSSSVALLADTVHNVGDTLNSIPLLIAFYLARRAATRRYTYGFGRAEDVAGIFIVLSIAVSAGVVFWESIQKLLNPQPMQNIPWVAAAAMIGFLGNEAVALLQIRVGRRIGSDALITDGLHARIDGLTSLAVLIAAAGTALGLPILDPIIGLMIGVAILFITRDAAVRIWYRLMDAVDPGLVNQISHYILEVEGVQAVQLLRIRWVGHQMFAEIAAGVGDQVSFTESQQIAGRIEQCLRRAVPHLSEVTIQIVPQDTAALLQVEQRRGVMNILPARYQLTIPSAAPMGAAGLKLDSEGKAAWNEIWTDFCDLALAGGPPHRGSLLEPVPPDAVLADPIGYEEVIRELERGIRIVTGLNSVRSQTPGWIGLECSSESMALWLLRAIVVENVSVRREEKVLYFPAGPNFRLEKEVKNIITVIAKTNHYWIEHMTTQN